MEYIINKEKDKIVFLNKEDKSKFDYIKLVESLHNNEDIKIIGFDDKITDDEKKIIQKTVKDLNDLKKPSKRKSIISQYSE